MVIRLNFVCGKLDICVCNIDLYCLILENEYFIIRVDNYVYSINCVFIILCCNKNY